MNRKKSFNQIKTSVVLSTVMLSTVLVSGFSAGAVKFFELGKVYEKSASAIAAVYSLLDNTGSKDDMLIY
nr:hypothetical protein [uncultured Treponema sp.]